VLWKLLTKKMGVANHAANVSLTAGLLVSTATEVVEVVLAEVTGGAAPEAVMAGIVVMGRVMVIATHPGTAIAMKGITLALSQRKGPSLTGKAAPIGTFEFLVPNGLQHA
jgi:hypothetical protein